MTGAVKEEILARQAEVGLVIENGCICFTGLLISPDELLKTSASFDYIDINRKSQRIEVPTGGLAYTVCQVPVVVQFGDTSSIEIHLTDGQTQTIRGNQLDPINSQHIFQRDGYIHHLKVHLYRKPAKPGGFEAK
jgi:hypothetical protein